MRVENLVRHVVSKVRRALFPEKEARLKLLSMMPTQAVCVEVGVWKGAFSQQILAITNPKMLHLVDPWAFQPEFSERMYGGKVAKAQRDMDEIHRDLKHSLGARNDVTIHRGFSDEVLRQFPDGCFDWLYIDGNHHYEYVKKDLHWAFVKVRAGGFIAGDDYYWGPEMDFPVRRAVREFVRSKGLRVSLVGGQFVIRKR